jgi:nucleotide-binding universal stress UspA family protein
MVEILGGFGAMVRAAASSARSVERATQPPLLPPALTPTLKLTAQDAVVTLDPDPAVDAAHVRAAKEMMRRRFVAKLAAADVPCAAEIVHFLTDADSIGEAVCRRAAALRPAAVCMAKHQRGRISEFFLGSATKCECSSSLDRTRRKRKWSPRTTNRPTNNQRLRLAQNRRRRRALRGAARDRARVRGGARAAALPASAHRAAPVHLLCTCARPPLARPPRAPHAPAPPPSLRPRLRA